MLSLPRQELKGHFTGLPMDEVHFGAGCLDALSAELDKQGVSRAVIVTGHTLAQKTDLVEKVAAAAGNTCAGVFHETAQHVPRRTVIAAADYARSSGTPTRSSASAAARPTTPPRRSPDLPRRGDRRALRPRSAT